MVAEPVAALADKPGWVALSTVPINLADDESKATCRARAVTRRPSTRALAGLLLVAALGGCQTATQRQPTTPGIETGAACAECTDARSGPGEGATEATLMTPLVDPATPAEATREGPTPTPGLLDLPAWQLLQDGLHPTLCERSEVRRWQQRYLGRPDAFTARLSEFAPLLDYVSREVALRDLPMQFALIPMVESNFYGFPGRGGGPAGIWQLMPTTARSLGLRVDVGHDDRLDPVRATHAALEYLGRLHTQFEADVELSLAAYNAGDGRLRRALKASASRDPRMARLPRITLEYLDKIEALACLFKDPQAYGWQLPTLPPESRLEIVVLPYSADAIRLAAALRLPEDSFRRYNGALRGPQLRPAGHAWLVPAQRVQAMATIAPEQVAADPAKVIDGSRPAVHVVRKGDNLWALARRYRLSVAELQRWNGLPRNALLSIGQRLKLTP